MQTIATMNVAAYASFTYFHFYTIWITIWMGKFCPMETLDLNNINPDIRWSAM